MTKHLSTVDELAALVLDGASIIIAKDPSSPVGLAEALIRRNARNLHLITLPTGSYISDVLIGAGCIKLVETSGVSLGEFGAAGRFVEAIKNGSIEIKDSTCPAVYAALQAGEKGQPFTTLRGLIGSDILNTRPDYKIIENPFQPDDQIVALPAIQPDFALVHADLADIHGNVWVGGRHEIKCMSHAAKKTLVTVEETVDHDLRLDPGRSPNLISSIYVTAIATAPGAAWPTAQPGRYDRDDSAHAAYATASRSKDGFTDWLNQCGLNCAATR
ncbi:MAG: CoA transferase subunit A [Pikeienuella sp.]